MTIILLNIYLLSIIISLITINQLKQFKYKMLAHKTKHFTQLLQICSFFKFYIKSFQSQLPEIIKLMTFNQLYQNIINDKYQTTLIKQILIFLLTHIHNPQFFKNFIGGSTHYLIGLLQNSKYNIIQRYYTQIAIQEYLLLTQSKQNGQKYIDTYNFCQLDLETKFKLLSTLVTNINQIIVKQKQSKTKSDNDQPLETKPSTDTKNKDKLEEVLLLGQDGRKLYFFFDFINEYVLVLQLGRWELLNRQQVIELIKKLLKMPMSTGNLALIQNLSKIEQKYMKSINQFTPQIRLHPLKQQPAQLQKLRVQQLKTQLLNINQRYCKYLKNYNYKYWGYLNQRKNYVDSIIKSQKIQHLISAYMIFYSCSTTYIYQCLCQDEQQIPQQNPEQYYQKQTVINTRLQKYFCNINTVTNKILDNKEIAFHIRSTQLISKLITETPADTYALFEINILLLKNAINYLQEKARRYFEKMRKIKKIQEQQKMKLGEEEASRKVNVMELRKKNKKKMFGVFIMDSDDEVSISRKTSQGGSSLDFEAYKYNTRNAVRN